MKENYTKPIIDIISVPEEEFFATSYLYSATSRFLYDDEGDGPDLPSGPGILTNQTHNGWFD